MNWNRLLADIRVRAIAVAAAAVGLPALFAQTGLCDRIESWSDDWQQRALARPVALEQVVVIDVDDDSVSRLSAQYGTWPFDRKVYADANAALLAAGARAIAYHLPLDYPRTGDAPGPSRETKIVFGAIGLPVPPRAGVTVDSGVAEAALPFGSPPPRREWAGVKAPPDASGRLNPGSIGVTNLTADADGTLRRIPLFHLVDGRTFPSLVLAAMMASDRRNLLVVDGRIVQLGTLSVTLSRSGEALVRFPSNTADLRVVPLHRVLAAAGDPRARSALAEAVSGRTVFVGRSVPPIASFHPTPVGVLSDLQLTALGYALVSQGQVLRPASLAVDALLVAVALALPLGLFTRGSSARPMQFAGGALLVPVLLWAAGGVLFATGIASNWLFGVLVSLVGIAVVSTIWLMTLYDKGRQLALETRAANEASRLKTEFLNQLAHELRTPLTAIMGFNKVNQFTDDLGREARIKNAEIIGRNCEHLLILINNQLDLAKISAGTLEIAPAAEDPEEICRDAMATVRAFAEEKRLRLRFIKRTPLPPALMLDAFRVRQILINLLGNAVKFTQQGSVELAVSWHIAAIEIEVSDTGPGILTDALERIFEPYQQADSTIASRFGGTGLGLAISRRLVEMMGGTIEVESKVGIGTTFRVRLPSESVARRSTAEPESLAAAREPLVGRVLLAEDNDDIRALIEHHLARLGIDAKAVANGFSAVDAALAAPYDVVLMDMEMPVMNGYEAAHVLRERGYRGTIYALTAHQGGEEAQRALSAGCDGIVTKPITLETLRGALRPLLPGAPRKAAAG